ncbi:class I SAM-dependent methyltransferase [Ktedonosporobacter rubrisoli]|uniref:Class I SAM-dependent methyltransferase n=1 Tax=Ktedonosporobacter rubrisoli TaxID=2509675 RepID=A0A4V0YYH2_KTERU|nr:class I SAM-dependent methyltransferase [Ktedonosporobacter rubrisoli]QBD76211.1 class I SAM-dependent methyltransferase [Ktedonosporobacter rubrisoli]
MTRQVEYFPQLVAAYIRDKLPADQQYASLFSKPLAELTEAEIQQLIQLAQQQELRIHRFKRSMELPRVQKVLGMLKGLYPSNLLDIGSGRGAFLWPLLDSFPTLAVTCVDMLDYRVADIQAVQRGGIEQLQAVQADVTRLPFAEQSFEMVTMLEVLEHVPDTRRALSEICRVARQFVILSVPSKEDDNPEHIHLFAQHSLRDLLLEQGVRRVSFDYVPGHMLALAHKG